MDQACDVVASKDNKDSVALLILAENLYSTVLPESEEQPLSARSRPPDRPPLLLAPRRAPPGAGGASGFPEVSARPDAERDDKRSVIMSVSVHENRKSRTSTGSMNILLFHKASHPDCVLSHLNTLRKHRMFTDVTLWAGNRSFPCHRAVLAASSRYFEAMFSNGLRESLDDEVNFHDSLHPEVLELLLDFAYSSRIIINEENAESLLEAGDMLQFHDVRDAAAEFLEKNLYPSNCLGMMLLSDAHQCRRLYELSWRMCLVNFETVHKSEDFNNLSKDTLLDLISSDELEIEDEEKVFKAVIQWVKYDLDERKAYLPELLRNVRLALLPSECLKEALACEDLIMVDERNKLVLDEAIQCKKKILQNDGVVTSPCARPRKAGHTLLILGGQTFMCDKIYQVDHKAKEIIPKADLPSPRKEFSACAIGCKVYITGGRGSENGVSKDVWVYDTVHEEWSKAAPMLIARFGHGSAELENCLYVVGGHTAVAGVFPASPSVSLKQVEKYDPVANKWTMVAPLRDGVSNAAVVSARLKLFVFGGTSIHRDMVSKVQCYEPAANRWMIKAECPQPWRYTAAAVLGSQIFIMGGDTEFTAASAYRFDCETDQWTRIGDMTAKRMSCHALASGNKLYVVGGYFGTQSVCQHLEALAIMMRVRDWGLVSRRSIRCQSHLHVPCLTAGADTANKFPPVPCPGLRKAFHIPSRHQEQEAQPALPPAPCYGGTKGHPAPPPATARGQQGAGSVGCWAGYRDTGTARGCW
ncbi:kelch-like protein 25 [Patagioenas fasciata monilis]|uniref:Kelch-like protein 25 n=1 Tax=Patagioenas fasciata monilis TaxID=372326 RepID=A0A1V4JEC4_PATFA|nr:kelch-like protein 25 [Patagioenas fasciata monilis]